MAALKLCLFSPKNRVEFGPSMNVMTDIKSSFYTFEPISVWCRLGLRLELA